MRKLIILLFLLGKICLPASTQSEYLDSLNQAYQTESDDTRFKSLYRYCYGLQQIDTAKTFQLISIGLQELDKSNLPNPKKAYLKGLFTEIRALVVSDQGDYKRSLNYYQDCLEYSKIAEGIDRYSLEGIAYWGRGTKYGQQGLFQQSNKNLLLAKEAFKLGNEESRVGSVYAQISQNYQQLEKYDSTLIFINKAIRISESMDNDWVIYFYTFLKANAFNELGLMDSTIAMVKSDFLEKAKSKQPIFYAHIVMSLSDAHAAKKQIEIAQKLMKDAKIVVDQVDEKQLYQNYLYSSLKLEKAAGNYKNAFTVLEQLRIFEDSLNQSQTDQKFMELQTMYDTQSKDFQITSLENKSKYQRNLMWTGGIFFAVTLISMLLYFRNLLEKKKAIQSKNNQQIRLVYKYEEPVIENDFLQKITSEIQKNIDNDQFVVDDLVQKMEMNRNAMNKKIKSLTNKTAVRLIRDIRLEKAKTLLLKNGKNVSEIAFEVGFNDPNYFSSCFKDHFGVPPSEVKKIS